MSAVQRTYTYILFYILWKGVKVATTSDIPTNTNQLTNGAGYVTSSGSVASATKATQDGSGNNIVNTYATKTQLTNVENKIPTDYVTTSQLGTQVTYEVVGGKLYIRTKA